MKLCGTDCTYKFSFLVTILLLMQEKVVEIEYIKAIVPRKQEEPCLHEDWVSAVDGSDPG